MKSKLPLIFSLFLLLVLGFIFGIRPLTGRKLSSGIETQYIDPTIRMQDDFFGYVNGKWLKSVEIPKDKASWGSFVLLREVVEGRLKEIIENAAKDQSANKSPELQKIGDFYASFMDEKKIEALGVAPIQAKFDRIAELKNKKEIS